MSEGQVSAAELERLGFAAIDAAVQAERLGGTYVRTGHDTDRALYEAARVAARDAERAFVDAVRRGR